MKRPLVIGLITVDDANDRRSWSGIHYFLLQALREQGHQVVLLGPLRPQPILFLCQLFNQVALRLLGKRFHYRDSFVLSRAYARVLEARIASRPLDLLIAPAGLAAIASLRTTLPIVYMNDRCLAGAIGYHEILKDLLAFSREQSLELERRALHKAALSVYTSRWASDAAMAATPDMKERIRTIPMGANLERIPPPLAHRDFPPQKLKLLFVGVHWENKGGPVAFEALQELKRSGVQAELVVCGCTPPASINDPDLRVEGFLDKNDPAQRAKLEQHFATADLFILPTRFEAYGIVFCEAAAYGIPALGSRTGGVPTIIEEGVTGFTFELNADGKAYAQLIIALVKDPPRWQAMRLAARERYEKVFTWQAFTTKLFAYIEEAGLVSKAR